VVACVAVQQQLRLFRDGLRQLLESQDDVEVVGVAVTAHDLVLLCQKHDPEVVVLDADARDWDVVRLTTALRRGFPGLRIIGLADCAPRPAEIARARRCGMSDLLCRKGGVSEILGAIRNGHCSLKPLRAGAPHNTVPVPPPHGAERERPGLTERELAVLNLVGAGCNAREISHRLTISQKTVENHKQRIFRKLGVQNQAHAVAIASKAGLLRPDRIIDLS